MGLIRSPLITTTLPVTLVKSLRFTPRCGAPDPQSGSWSQFLGDFGRRNGGINTAEIFQNHRNISPSDDYGYKAIVISPSSIT